MEITQELITPSKAKYLLTKNLSNRKLAPQHVAFLSRQMKLGEWSENGESIKFDVDGVLLDGQHRLLAIVQSNTSQNMLVVNNINSETFGTIDTGRPRSAADVLFKDKRKNHVLLSSCSRLILSFRELALSNNAVRSNYITNRAITDLVSSDIDLTKAVDFVVGHSNLKIILSPSIASFLYYQYTAHNAELGKEFLTLVSGGANSNVCPSHTIREFLIKSKLGKVKLDSMTMICLTTKYFMLFCAGSESKKMSNKFDLDAIEYFIKDSDRLAKFRAKSFAENPYYLLGRLRAS